MTGLCKKQSRTDQKKKKQDRTQPVEVENLKGRIERFEGYREKRASEYQSMMEIYNVN